MEFTLLEEKLLNTTWQFEQNNNKIQITFKDNSNDVNFTRLSADININGKNFTYSVFTDTTNRNVILISSDKKHLKIFKWDTINLKLIDIFHTQFEKELLNY